MIGIRRALLFSSVERYSTILLNFLLIAVVSRLLTPSEIGVSAIGVTIMSFAEGVRDSPSSYLVQKETVTRDDTRTAFTIMVSISIIIALALVASAHWLESILRQDRLAPFLYVIAVGLLPACIERPIMALLRRDMAFATYATISVMSALVALVVTVILAVLGFSFMSFAWGQLAGSVSAALLALYFRPHFWIFQPHLSEARNVLPFNGYGSVKAIITAIYDMVPYLILGRLSQLNAVGFYSRAVTVCRLPDKLNAGLISLALPTFSLIAREGGNLAAAYLSAISYVTIVEWPLRAMLVIFAHPVVMLILGPQWVSIVPLVQIMSLAYIFAAPQILSYPVLVASGGVRDSLSASLTTWPFAVVLIGSSALIGLKALAFSMFLIVPLQTFVEIRFIRKRVPFRLREFLSAIEASIVVTLCSTVGPLLLVAVSGFSFNLSFPQAVLGGVLALAGWATGAWLLRHPIWFEIKRFADAIQRLISREAPGDAASTLVE